MNDIYIEQWSIVSLSANSNDIKNHGFLKHSCSMIILGLELQRIIAQQTWVHLRLTLGSVNGSYCSNIELGGLAWVLFYVHITICVHALHRGARPMVSLRWPDLRLHTCTVHRMTKSSASGLGATSLSPIQQQKFHHRQEFLSIKNMLTKKI